VKTVAFVPARGGSKSIPKKNIKPLCGKPLVFWVMSALQKTNTVDEIVLATDSCEIEETALAFNLSKTKIFRRSSENAGDASTTESVMLEYIDKSLLNGEDIFILAQATSPLTESVHFSEALSIYQEGKYDSMLACVRNYRFFWNEDGTSKNYDFRNRPRRQDFMGQLMENGAFYISTVGNIKQSKNRLSGKIGIYEMPDYTATEIDEPDDWAVLENLMYSHILSKRMESEIKLVLSDVDGVLTDGGMYYCEGGDELKKFNTRDGMGFQLLKENGIKTGIITSERTDIVTRRAKKLQVDYLYQGKKNKEKLDTVKDICKKEGILPENIAYIGDDINCSELLLNVGMAACPADAADKVKRIPNIDILSKEGGKGAFREFAEKILLKFNKRRLDL